MPDKSCSTCKYCKNNNCTYKNNVLEGDLKEQGCGDWEQIEIESATIK